LAHVDDERSGVVLPNGITKLKSRSAGFGIFANPDVFGGRRRLASYFQVVLPPGDSSIVSSVGGGSSFRNPWRACMACRAEIKDSSRLFRLA
jgi:hypothetical protein